MTFQEACLKQVVSKRQVTDWLSTDDAVMASGFCEDCSRLLKEFTARLRKVCREFEQKIRDVFRELSRCTCFRITPEKNFLRRTTQELTSLHLLYGRSIVVVSFLCCRQHFLWRANTVRLSLSVSFAWKTKFTKLMQIN